ncbi:interstitial collagenase-like [Pholidichthys leucotaenia]
MKPFGVVILWTLAAAVCCMPLTQITEQDEHLAENYLKKFFNLTKERGQTFSQSVSEMQKFFGLQITGKLDADTLAFIKQPHCGVPNFKAASYVNIPNSVNKQQRGFTYRIVSYPHSMTAAQVDNSIQQALQLWANVTPLTFRRLYQGTADIMISFVRGYHGDNGPFNPGDMVIAHAVGRDVHFNDYNTFTYNSFSGYILTQVATHEFGHSLGLGHSYNRDSVMYFMHINKDPRRFALHQEDVEAIQALYG